MFSIKNLKKDVFLIFDEIIKTKINDEHFLETTLPILEESISILLLSGGISKNSQYSILGWDPLLIYESKNSKIRIKQKNNIQEIKDDPFKILNLIFKHFQTTFPLKKPPFYGGAMGYFAYELKNQIENLPQQAKDDIFLPDLWLFFPSQILIHNRINKELRYIQLSLSKNTKKKKKDINFQKKIEKKFYIYNLHSNFSRNRYKDSIQQIHKHILDGDAYQVNLSQRFSCFLKGSSLSLFQQLFQLNPTPFYAYINAGTHKIISTSMERFLFRNDHFLETRPIKGTRRRGLSPKEDSLLRKELENSKKDSAELNMIIDLLRNDIGRICKPKSIKVVEHKKIETYQNVFHSVSTITGNLLKNISYGKILHATFPGGSITGCPKISSMIIIDKLEPTVRHVYTGSIGYLGWHDNMDLNIAIRTAIIKNGICYFSTGGGITFDSHDKDEYLETLHKANSFFKIMNFNSKNLK